MPHPVSISFSKVLSVNQDEALALLAKYPDNSYAYDRAQRLATQKAHFLIEQAPTV